MTLLAPTLTLAKLYADQGYWRIAAEIYRDLTTLQPDCDEAGKGLIEMERRLALRGAPGWKELRLLLRQWAELVKQEQRRRQRSLGCERG